MIRLSVTLVTIQSRQIFSAKWQFRFITLTHWGRVTHICVGKLTVIDSDNGLSPGQCQAIIWTNAGILLIGPLGTNFNETSIEIHTFSFKKIHLKLSSGKWRPFCRGLNVLTLLDPSSFKSAYTWEQLLISKADLTYAWQNYIFTGDANWQWACFSYLYLKSITGQMHAQV